MAKKIDGHFDRNQDSWKALAKFTLLDRMRKGFQAGPILIRTGELRAHAVEKVQFGDHSVTLSTAYPEAYKHEFGEGRIPARPFYLFYADEVTEILKAVAEAL